MTRSAAWVPAQIRWTATAALVDWCHLGALRFTHPFFEQTIAAAMDHPFNLLFGHATPLEELAEPEAFELRPAGLIFHTGRCGSTAITQMLSALPGNVVLSEPPPLDQVLRMPWRIPGTAAEVVVSRLRAMTGALARRRHAQERDFFVKLEPWHVFAQPLIRSAFPEVPWVFVHREPVEVLASLDSWGAFQTLPGGIPPELLGVTLAQAQEMPSEHYRGLVLEHLMRAALAFLPRGGGLLLDHRELPEAACGRMLAHFGLRYDEAQRARMRAAARFDAKHPGTPYADDSAAKRSAARAEIRRVAASLAPLYAELQESNKRGS